MRRRSRIRLRNILMIPFVLADGVVIALWTVFTELFKRDGVRKGVRKNG